MKGRYRAVLRDPLPSYMHSLPHQQGPPSDGAFVITDGPTGISHHHSESTVYVKAHSHGCPSAGLGPMYVMAYPSLWWPPGSCNGPEIPPLHPSTPALPHAYPPVLGAGLRFTTLPCPPALPPESFLLVSRTSIIFSQHWLTLLNVQNDVLISAVSQTVKAIWWTVSTTPGRILGQLKRKSKKPRAGVSFLFIFTASLKYVFFNSLNFISVNNWIGHYPVHISKLGIRILK